MFEGHTRFFIASEIQDCLQRFQLKPEQVLSFVTDTAKNMKAGVRIASIELEMKSREKQLEESGVQLPFNDSIHDSIDFESDCPEIEFDNSDDHDSLSENVAENFPYIFDIDCAAHVLQLGVNDFLKSKVIIFSLFSLSWT